MDNSQPSHTHENGNLEAEYQNQSQRLGACDGGEDVKSSPAHAAEAKFITPQDPVIETVDGGRLPAVPVEEGAKLNRLKDKLEGKDASQDIPVNTNTREAKDGTIHGARPSDLSSTDADAPLRQAVPPYRTNPLFPPLPLWGPPSLLRNLQCLTFRTTSAVLSLAFLLVIMLGALFTSIPGGFRRIQSWIKLEDPDKQRPFYHEEQRRRKQRKEAEQRWKRRVATDIAQNDEGNESDVGRDQEYVPTEGGPDPLVCDAGYYARRVGLDMETFQVQTEDGFILELWHIFNPREYKRATPDELAPHSPEVFQASDDSTARKNSSASQLPENKKRYPVLLIHGLLQSGGAYCASDDDSLAFFLAKSGYDVWIGNNRCGFIPKHNCLTYRDPRMWAWNIRQMGVMDLPALISRVLSETGFEQLGLVAHSQGTAETLVALAKEQRPDIGPKISVFCALAPAAYAGPLIGKMYFKFMRIISVDMFRIMFGIHAFIPFMMKMHQTLPGRFYGAMGYRIFAFLFNWTDDRWEASLRNRLFQFAPVYVSAESMRWWLGRECFATQKCILSTRAEGRLEDEEDEEEDKEVSYYKGHAQHPSERTGSKACPSGSQSAAENTVKANSHEERGRFAWYDKQAPPMAFWVCGRDDLVDGRRLLRRFERGREPYVDLVHSKIIEGYEHLDVIWAMDSIEKVGKEVREIIWRTASDKSRESCRAPSECDGAKPWTRHGGRISLNCDNQHLATRQLDSTAGEWQEELTGRQSTGNE